MKLPQPCKPLVWAGEFATIALFMLAVVYGMPLIEWVLR